MTTPVDISPEAVERYAKAVESCEWTYLFNNASDNAPFREHVAGQLRALRSALTASEKDAAKWRLAIDFLRPADIEGWALMKGSGHSPITAFSKCVDDCMNDLMAGFTAAQISERNFRDE
jgi:hypothetical protein